MEEPVVYARSLKGIVSVGAVLKSRLEEAARLQGADASYLARVVLRDYLDVHECPAGVEAEHEQ